MLQTSHQTSIDGIHPSHVALQDGALWVGMRFLIHGKHLLVDLPHHPSRFTSAASLPPFAVSQMASEITVPSRAVSVRNATADFFGIAFRALGAGERKRILRIQKLQHQASSING